MTSARQVVANKANAKRSTGPRSLKGKARSRSNAQKHGLTAEHILIAGEDASECEVFATEIIEDLMPVGRLEQALAERVAALLWRLNRVSLFEAAVVEAREAVGTLRKWRNAAYQGGKADLAKDTKILNFDGIDKAMAEAQNIKSFKGISTSPSTTKMRAAVQAEIDFWKSLNLLQLNYSSIATTRSKR